MARIGLQDVTKIHGGNAVSFTVHTPPVHHDVMAAKSSTRLLTPRPSAGSSPTLASPSPSST